MALDKLQPGGAGDGQSLIFNEALGVWEPGAPFVSLGLTDILNVSGDGGANSITNIGNFTAEGNITTTAGTFNGNGSGLTNVTATTIGTLSDNIIFSDGAPRSISVNAATTGVGDNLVLQAGDGEGTNAGGDIVLIPGVGGSLNDGIVDVQGQFQAASGNFSINGSGNLTSTGGSFQNFVETPSVQMTNTFPVVFQPDPQTVGPANLNIPDLAGSNDFIALASQITDLSDIGTVSDPILLDNSTLRDAVIDLSGSVQDVNTAIGILPFDTDLGTFGGTTIGNNVTVRTALGQLETAVEGITSSQWITSGSDISFTPGNVGIGTATPTATIDVQGTANVSGNITSSGVATANDFQYSSAVSQTKSYSALVFERVQFPGDASEFITFNATTNYKYFNGTVGNLGYAVAHVDLPSGAVVTEVRGWLFDNNATFPTRIELVRADHGTGTDIIMASFETVGQSGAVQQLFDDTITSSIIDNSAASYFLRFTGVNDNQNETRLYNATITYSVQKPN
jgi:hypothetical protein